MSQSRETRKAISESVRCLLKQTSFADISVEDICVKAGISRRTFYRYFFDKYEVVIWIFEREYSQYIHKLGKNNETEGLQEFCCVLYGDRDFYRRAFQIEGQNSFADYCMKLLQNYMKQEFNLMVDGGMTEVFLDHIVRAVFENMKLWLAKENSVMPGVFLNRLADTLGMLGGKAYFYCRHRQQVI